MRRKWNERLERRTIVIHTTDGQSLRGVLVGEYRDSLVLSHAYALGAQAVQAIDGEAVIPRERVAWVQSLPTAVPKDGNE